MMKFPETGRRPKILVVGAFAESLINFRGKLIQLLLSKGYRVCALASDCPPSISEKLKSMGASYGTYEVDRTGLSILGDLKTLSSLRRLYLTSRPDVILAYTVKPVIWGGLASRALPSVRFYGLITGLGYAMEGEGLKRRTLSTLVGFLYKLSLKNAEKVVFQNPDNMRVFVEKRIVPREKCEVVNGSGVDLAYFQKAVHQPHDGVVFLMICRLLGEKGVREYVEAARAVKIKYPKAHFQLIGPLESSPDAIPKDELDRWISEGVIDYLGEKSDVRDYLKQCDIYVLPSYHEGTPRTILEAMAVGRPILTTDVPGCRETVEEEENGFLVPKGDSKELAYRMEWFINHRDDWPRMADYSRRIAENKYDVHAVNQRLLEIMRL